MKVDKTDFSLTRFLAWLIRSTNSLQGQGEQSNGKVVDGLRSGDDWLAAAASGRVGFSTVMAKENKIPPEWFDAVVAACGDTPQF